MRYKIGYVDEDSQQVSLYERKLRKHFDVVGYNIVKGTTIESLLDQIYDSGIDLLLVDFMMVDKGIVTFNGDEVVRKFEEIKPVFPIIIFTNEEAQAFPQVDNPNIIYDKSLAITDLDRLIEIIRKNIDVYKRYIKKREDIIVNLLEKKAAKHELSSSEKHILMQTQIELINLDKRSNEAPMQLLNVEVVDNVEKIRKEAEELLEDLIRRKNESI